VKLLYVGSAEAHKNIGELVHILRGLRGRGVLASLVVTLEEDDPAPSVTEMRDALRRMNMDSIVAWLGTQDRPAMADLYRQADIVLSPSLCESYGFSVIESLSMGTPVLSSDIPAAREVGRGEGVVFYSSGQTQEAVDGILRLVGSSPLSRPSVELMSWGEYAFQMAAVLADLGLVRH
jgi:glycosyltransferase involved in cell wall biosynthesis